MSWNLSGLRRLHQRMRKLIEDEYDNFKIVFTTDLKDEMKRTDAEAKLERALAHLLEVQT